MLFDHLKVEDLVVGRQYRTEQMASEVRGVKVAGGGVHDKDEERRDGRSMIRSGSSIRKEKNKQQSCESAAKIRDA